MEATACEPTVGQTLFWGSAARSRRRESAAEKEGTLPGDGTATEGNNAIAEEPDEQSQRAVGQQKEEIKGSLTTSGQSAPGSSCSFALANLKLNESSFTPSLPSPHSFQQETSTKSASQHCSKEDVPHLFSKMQERKERLAMKNKQMNQAKEQPVPESNNHTDVLYWGRQRNEEEEIVEGKFERLRKQPLALPADQRTMAAALHLLIVTIRRKLGMPEMANTIFQPPPGIVPTTAYPVAVQKEDVDYFVKEREKEEQRRLRVVQAKAIYTFDRSMSAKVRKESQKTLPKAEASSNWVAQQNRVMLNQRQQYEHLLTHLEHEQKQEVERELELLRVSLRQGDKEMQKRRARIVKERLEAADRIVRLLDGYRLAQESEVLEYLRSFASSSVSSATVISNKSTSKSRHK